LIGACDHQQILAIGVDVIANNRVRESQGQSNVIKLGENESALVHGCRLGETHWAAEPCELLMQVEAAEIERQFGLQSASKNPRI